VGGGTGHAKGSALPTAEGMAAVITGENTPLAQTRKKKTVINQREAL
jgi:hypothetical protein